jgi:hypothetical protein
MDVGGCGGCERGSIDAHTWRCEWMDEEERCRADTHTPACCAFFFFNFNFFFLFVQKPLWQHGYGYGFECAFRTFSSTCTALHDPVGKGEGQTSYERQYQHWTRAAAYLGSTAQETFATHPS